MANPDLAFGALAKPTRLDRDVAKHQRRVAKRSTKRETDKAEVARWRAICDVIFKRDQGRCRACGKRVKRDAENPMVMAHTHHVTYRSAGGDDSLKNLALLCGWCHDREHRHILDIRGDGNGELHIVQRDPETGRTVQSWPSHCPTATAHGAGRGTYET